MGFPFAGGWAEQPKMIVDMIQLFEGIYNEEQSIKMEKNKTNKPGKSNKTTKSFNTLQG